MVCSVYEVAEALPARNLVQGHQAIGTVSTRSGRKRVRNVRTNGEDAHQTGRGGRRRLMRSPEVTGVPTSVPTSVRFTESATPTI